MASKKKRAAEVYDLVIVGGGPAGATLGSLIKKYRPEKKVLILEKEFFPRHHVGESLLLGIVPILKEMGAYEKIDGAGFPRKLGASYVWGKDRTPWDVDFSEVDPASLLGADGAVLGDIKYTWQVRRDRYDQILLTHAAECGVEVRHGVAADAIIEEGERIVGLTTRGVDGAEGEIRCEFVADCSGQRGFLSRYRRIRRHDKRLGNVALHAYYKGARWKVEFQGHPDKTKIFVCSTASGWFWYIPIEKDVVSVGYVSHREELGKREVRDLKTFFLETLAGCDELAPLLKDASLISDYAGSGKDFFVERDWSYLNVASSGPGWLAAGDACVFVDPILSSGVLLAHMAGKRAASTLATCWGENSADYKAMLWQDYNDYYRRAAAHFLATVMFWYGNDLNAQHWWVAAQKIVRSSAPFPVKSKQAFVVIAAGVQDYYERMYQAEYLFSERPTEAKTYMFIDNAAWSEAGEDAAAAGVPARDARLKLACPYEVGNTFLPEFGTGTLRPLKRVKFLLQPTEDPLTDILNPTRLVLPPHLALLKDFDGTSTFGKIVDGFTARRGVSAGLSRRAVEKFTSDLVLLGVLAVCG